MSAKRSSSNFLSWQSMHGLFSQIFKLKIIAIILDVNHEATNRQQLTNVSSQCRHAGKFKHQLLKSYFIKVVFLNNEAPRSNSIVLQRLRQQRAIDGTTGY